MQAWREFAVRSLKRPAVVMGLLAALLATQILPLWTPTPDGAGYLSIARSMAHGGPVTNMGSPKLHYPPGYPLLISPAFWFGDRPFLLLALVQWLFAVAIMLGVYRWARQWFPGSELWITALVMSNVSLWIHARTTISEMPFMALLIWTAIALDRLAAAPTARSATVWSLVGATAIAALGMIRPVGILIVTGYALVVFLQARGGRISWRRAVGTTFVLGAPAAVAIAALIAYEARTAAEYGTRGDPTYLHEFKAADLPLAVQLLEGLRVRVAEVGRLLLPGMNKSYAKPYQWVNVNTLIYTPFFVAIAWAWWQIAVAGGSTLWLMVPCYLALYIAYPSDQGTRYLLPLLPVLAVCLWWFVWQASRRRVQVLAGFVAAHLLVTIAYSSHSTVRLARLGHEWQAVDAFAEIMRRDPRPVACWNAPYGIRELTMVASDHWCGEVHGPETAVPDEVDWLVAEADAPSCDGFVERAREGDLKLLGRVAHVAHARAKTLR
ncbi:MAG TPA: hypothetical protein VHD36_18380 [Pirellulales bacterium]|nr:hypothetical protein [Pirellulales bacterium]